MTKGDQIRQMSNEELANMLSETSKKCFYCSFNYLENEPTIFCNAICEKGIKAYLDMEVEE